MEFGTSPKPAVFREPAPAGTGRPGSRDFTCSGKRLSGPIPLGAHDGRCWLILGDQDGSIAGTPVRGHRRPESDMVRIVAGLPDGATIRTWTRKDRPHRCTTGSNGNRISMICGRTAS